MCVYGYIRIFTRTYAYNYTHIRVYLYAYTCIRIRTYAHYAHVLVNVYLSGTVIDFTLSNARQFYSSKGDPLGVNGLSGTLTSSFGTAQISLQILSSGVTFTTSFSLALVHYPFPLQFLANMNPSLFTQLLNISSARFL